MAKAAKKPKIPSADAWASAIQDGKITSDELKAIKQSETGKEYLSASYLDTIKKILAGDTGAITSLGGYTSLENGKNNNPYLDALLKDKGVNAYLKEQAYQNPAVAGFKGFLNGLNKSVDKNYTPDFQQFTDPLQQKIAASMYYGAGKTDALDPNTLANLQGKAFDANGQITEYGMQQRATGMGDATNLNDFAKQFYFDNYANQFFNADSSLTTEGQKKFNEFWMQSGIPDKATALAKFNGQFNPMYTAPASTATDTGPQLPTNPLDLSKYTAQNFIGKSVAPLTTEQMDAAQAVADTARAGIAGGDRNAAARNYFNNLITQQSPVGNYAAPQISSVPMVNADFSGTNIGKLGAPTVGDSFSAPTTDYSKLSAPEKIDISKFSQPGVGGPGQVPMIDAGQFKAPKDIAANFQAYMLDPEKFANAPQQVKAMMLNAPQIAMSDNAYLGADNPFARQDNPYLQSMVDKSGADITRNYNNGVFNNTDALMARAGAFGGSAWEEAQRNNAHQFTQDLADATNSLRYQAYNQAAQLNEADLARNSQLANNLLLANQDTASKTGVANQGAQLSADQGNQQADIASRLQYLNSLLGNQSAYGQANALNLQALTANQNAALTTDKTRLDALLGNQNAQLGNNKLQLDANIANAQMASQYNQLLMSAMQANQQMQAQQNDLMLRAQQGDQQAALQLQKLKADAQQANQQAQIATNQLNQSGQLSQVMAQLQAQTANQGAFMQTNQLNQSAIMGTNSLNQNGQLGWNNLLLNGAQFASSLPNSVYQDAGALSGAGGLYQNYTQALINENLNAFNTAQNWNQQQNNQFGNAISSMGNGNSVQQTNSPAAYIPQPYFDYGGVLSNAIGGAMAGYGAFGGSSGSSGGNGAGYANNAGLWNGTNSSFFGTTNTY